ncbi:MAG TPA: FAD-dependent oxidoreductase [Verrucomicrobiae bacterium]|nr:FAD-dependent oxidoreductase [Verrucomicrobiae bacterium]
MPHYTYLIIGGGMTTDAATRGIREVDAGGTIGMIGQEPDAPYDRPPLTKGLWKGQQMDSIWRHTRDRRVELHLERRVESVDLEHKSVTDERRNIYTFDKLLLATGGTPRRLPFGGGQIIYYRTVEDYRRLRQLTEKHQRFAVIGGGFIGSEIAAALAMSQKEVVMLFPGKGIGGRQFPADLTEFLNQYYRLKGVEVLAGESVLGMDERGGGVVLKTQGGKEIMAEGVVAGLGIQPNIELARQAGLKTADGIEVDEFLRTSRPDVYAAGDVAEFYNPALGKRLRVEHEDNANAMGRQAGRNLAGKSEPYQHLPFFYSDLFDLGYEAVGELDARLETVADWKQPYREGVVYYLREGRVRGVLLWNLWGQVDHARQLIAEPGPFRSGDLKGRLPRAG